MKGIVLAGGRATRLYPITKGITKQLLPVYDKPLVYYPLSVLMLAGLRDILLISSEGESGRFKELLGDGGQLGIRLSYAVQAQTRGIAESFLIAEEFIRNEPVALILGDNIFYGQGLVRLLKEGASLKKGARIFGCYVNNPGDYGVMELDGSQKVIGIEEKPVKPKSNWAVTGLYFYDPEVAALAKKLKPSKRGELEITDINNLYLKNNSLKVNFLGRDFTWLDTGTFDSLIDASNFIKTIEERQGRKIGCLEEIAYKMGYITRKELLSLAEGMENAYGRYLRKIGQNG